MRKKHVLLVAGLAVLSGSVLNTGPVVNALGPSPAFEKTEDMSQDKLHQLILQDVKTKIQSVAPAMKAGYPGLMLGKVLSTDYASVDYPSKVEGTNEGIDSDGNIVLSALKKPITEQARMDLAELVRFYQFNMSSEREFAPMKQGNGIVGARDTDVETKLNYFEYIKLIDAIADNTNYSKEEKVRRLGQVEKDLQNSISVLYGDLNSAIGLQAWGDAKRVSVPFKRDKFSYKQLLAAYEKNDVVIATLDYYSSILDTLEQIRQYSVERRHQRPASIDAVALADNVNAKYAKVTEVLVQPVADIYSVKLDEEIKLKAGQEEEARTLQSQGIAKEENKPSEGGDQ